MKARIKPESLHGRTAFISGAGRNIGRAIAVELAARSCNLVLNAMSNREECEATAALCHEVGDVQVVVCLGDVGRRSAVAEVADAALRAFPTVDIVVNNAGIRPHTPFLEMKDEDWHNVMDVNLNSAFFLCRAFLPGMCANGWGRVVSITGRTSIEGYPERAPVSVSKHGLWGLTKALAKEFGPKGVTANAISPGAIRRIENDDSTLARRAAEIPLGRIGEPEDVAALTGFLCSDEGAFVTGQMIASNGGVTT